MTMGLGVVLIGLMASAAQGGDEIVLRHDVGTRYSRIEYEAACGSTVLRIQFRNSRDDRGRIEHVLINGRPVPGAAGHLQIRVARRMIDRIGIMNCGMDERRPVFRGVMAMSEMESRRLGMRPSVYFRVSRKGHGGWTLSVDQSD